MGLSSQVKAALLLFLQELADYLFSPQPKPKTCKVCQGLGWVNPASSQQSCCEDCNGIGKIYPAKVPSPDLFARAGAFFYLLSQPKDSVQMPAEWHIGEPIRINNKHGAFALGTFVDFDGKLIWFINEAGHLSAVPCDHVGNLSFTRKEAEIRQEWLTGKGADSAREDELFLAAVKAMLEKSNPEPEDSGS